MRFEFVFTLVFVCSFVFSSFSWAQEAAPGEFIVKYKKGKLSAKTLNKTGVKYNLKLRNSWNRIDTYHFKLRDKSAKDSEVLRELKDDPDIAFVEPNYLVRSQSYSYLTTQDDIQAPESWGYQSENLRGDVNVPVVAVLDSGLDINHPIFKNTGRLWVNEAEANGTPGVDDDANGYIDDIHGWNFIDSDNNVQDVSSKGHGTHVAGIVVGSTEDIYRFDPYGSAKVRVMPLKFLNHEGIGKTSDAIRAIYYAVDNGAKILNNSWGGAGYSASLHQAVAYSFFHETLFVAAAGNSGSDNDITPVYPANYDSPNVISVGASTGSHPTSFSNYGENSVHVSAPGLNIISTYKGGGLGPMHGTSMAAPFISGLAALMRHSSPQLSGYQLKRDVIDTVDPFSSLSTFNSTSGRINFKTAVETAIDHSAEESYLPPYNPEYLSRGLASMGASSSGMGCGRVKELYRNHNQGGFKHHLQNFIVLALVILPLALFVVYRKRHERRSSERVDLDQTRGRLVFSNGLSLEIDVKDISLGGAGVFYEDQELPEIHRSYLESCKLIIQGASRAEKTYNCRVANFRGHNIGLQFTS